MRVRKVLRILSSASGRTLSCTLGRRACTDSFFGGRRWDNTCSGLWHTEAKSALSAFEQICSMDGVSSGRYPSRPILVRTAWSLTRSAAPANPHQVLWRIHWTHSPDGGLWSATRRDLQFLCSVFLTFLPQTLCSTTVNSTTRLLCTYQLAVFLSCMQTSVLCHFSMDYVRLSHFSSVKLCHSNALVTGKTLVLFEES